MRCGALEIVILGRCGVLWHLDVRIVKWTMVTPTPLSNTNNSVDAVSDQATPSASDAAHAPAVELQPQLHEMLCPMLPPSVVISRTSLLSEMYCNYSTITHQRTPIVAPTSTPTGCGAAVQQQQQHAQVHVCTAELFGILLYHGLLGQLVDGCHYNANSNNSSSIKCDNNRAASGGDERRPGSGLRAGGRTVVVPPSDSLRYQVDICFGDECGQPSRRSDENKRGRSEDDDDDIGEESSSKARLTIIPSSPSSLHLAVSLYQEIFGGAHGGSSLKSSTTQEEKEKTATATATVPQLTAVTYAHCILYANLMTQWLGTGSPEASVTGTETECWNRTSPFFVRLDTGVFGADAAVYKTNSSNINTNRSHQKNNNFQEKQQQQQEQHLDHALYLIWMAADVVSSSTAVMTPMRPRCLAGMQRLARGVRKRCVVAFLDEKYDDKPDDHDFDGGGAATTAAADRKTSSSSLPLQEENSIIPRTIVGHDSNSTGTGTGAGAVRQCGSTHGHDGASASISMSSCYFIRIPRLKFVTVDTIS